MKKDRKTFSNELRYLCLFAVIFLGLITISCSLGGEEDECNLPGPTSLTESISGGSITFRWSAVRGAVEYAIRFSTEANLTEFPFPLEDSCPGGSLETNPGCVEYWTGENEFLVGNDFFGAPSGTYYWAVVPVCENGLTGNWSSPKGFLFINPSDTSCCPHPENGKDSISINTFLSWCQSNTTLSGNLTYDIYLGTTETPLLVKSNHETLYYFPDYLNDDTTYYWKIISRNDQGLTEEGPLWQFHTHAEQGNNLPDTPSDPWPKDGAVNIVPPVYLSWSCNDPDEDEITYHLFYGINEALKNHAQCIHTTSHLLSSLSCSYHCYWKVIAEDEYGAAVEGPLWYFDTPICGDTDPCEPCGPSNPYPSDDDTEVDPIEVNLTWECKDYDDDGMTFDLYWGITPTPEYGPSTLTTNSCTLKNLPEGTRIYWQGIAKDEHENVCVGPVWSFLTVGFSVPIENTFITEYFGEGIDLIYASARSESWNEYVNDVGIDEISELGGISAGQFAIAGHWVLGDPPQFGFAVWNYGYYTKGEYSLESKAGYSEAKLVIIHGFGPPLESHIRETFTIEFFIDGVKVAEQPYQNIPEIWIDRITIPLPFDSVKTGSKIPVEFKSNRTKQVNPVPLSEPEFFPVYCFETIHATARIVLE